MSKRIKVSSKHTSLRLPPDLIGEVDRLCESTDWSNARAIAFLCEAGRLALKGSDGALAAARDHLAGQVKLAAVVRDNARRLADARKALRTPTAGPGSRPGTTKAAKAARRPAVPKLPPAAAGSAA